MVQMSAANVQRRLSTEQVEAFHHDVFVTDQVADFGRLVPDALPGRTVTDVGGGCGFFARALAETQNLNTRVVDMDLASVSAARAAGVEAEVGDALAPSFRGDEDGACFNLILHHLVGDGAQKTRHRQSVFAPLQALLGDHPAPKQSAVQELAHRRARTLPLSLKRRAQLRAQVQAIDDVLDACGL